VTTVEDLLGMNVVPVFNENDAISKGVVKATVSLAIRHHICMAYTDPVQNT